ncbi:MAG TPA: hypothetical protein DDZ67_08055 [Xanthomonadaceae bacterium]|nr:hypothetical protein [Xanthomonadaceae bacterium]
MNSLRERLQRWPRPWRIAAVLSLALYALYLVAGNVFLNTPLFDAVTDRSPEKFRMQTGPAVTLLPGHIVAWNVHVRGHVRHTVYELHARRASGRIAILPLFRREVRIPRIEASEVTADVDRVEALMPSPPPGDRGWTLRFDAIHSQSIQRGRFGKLVIAGDGRGTVGFLKQIKGGPSELFPSKLQFARAQVRYGDLALLEQAHIEADFSYPRHYRAQAPGLRKLGITQARLRIEARTLALKIDTGGGHTHLSTVPAQATLQADVGLARGELLPGSRAVWRLPLLAGVGATDRGMLSLQLDVAQDMRLQARLPRDPDTGSELDADLRIAGRTLPFERPEALIPRTSGEVRGRWEFESLNWISDLFVRKPWFQLDGGGLVQGDLRIRQGELDSGSTFEVPHADAVAEVMGNRIAGAAQARGRVDGDAGKRQMRLDVAMPRFEVAPAAEPRAIFVEGRALQLQMTGDSRLDRLRETLKARLRFKDARVPDLTTYNRYLPQRNVKLLGGGGSFDGDLELDGAGEVGSGRVSLRGRGVRLSMAGVEMRGDADLDARVRRADLERRIFDLDGSTVELKRMRLADAADARPWWARVDVRRGRIDAKPPFQVDADADIRMKDASLVLSLFSQRGDYPRWIIKLMDAGEVQAHGRLRWRKDALVLDGLEAENDRLSMRARMEIGDAHRRGDLYVRWGVLGVGVGLDGEQRQWHLANARQWYEGRPVLLD